MHTVFITRNITVQSPFYQILIGLNVKGYSFIDFEPIVFSNLPCSDWVFFYSKNGIRFFLKQLEQLNLNPEDLELKWATIGQASADYLETCGINADFSGTGEPHSTSKAFLKIAKGQQVLFPRAVNSKKSIQNILGNQIQSIDLIIYNNAISTKITKREEDFLVFTSPMNAQAYFKKFQLDHFQKVIAIGQTTSKALIELGINDFTISAKPSEKGLAEAVLLIDNEQLIINNEKLR